MHTSAALSLEYSYSYYGNREVRVVGCCLGYTQTQEGQLDHIRCILCSLVLLIFSAVTKYLPGNVVEN